jgi:hypothetical protein
MLAERSAPFQVRAEVRAAIRRERESRRRPLLWPSFAQGGPVSSWRRHFREDRS